MSQNNGIITLMSQLYETLKIWVAKFGKLCGFPQKLESRGKFFFQWPCYVDKTLFGQSLSKNLWEFLHFYDMLKN